MGGISWEQIAESKGGQWRSQLFKAKRLATKKRGLTFALEFDQYAWLISKPCHYCGAAPSNVCRYKFMGHKLNFLYSGIDRVDNTRGYEPDNVVSCCTPCNTAKLNRPVADFLARPRRITESAK